MKSRVLKAWWEFRKPLQRYLHALFFLLSSFVNKLIFLFIICFEPRTQISIANQLHAGLAVSTVVFFVSLFLSTEASGHTVSQITLGTEKKGDRIICPEDNFSENQRQKLSLDTRAGASAGDE